MNYIDWFSHIEWALHSWDKAHLVIMYFPFDILLDWICYYFGEDFWVCIHWKYISLWFYFNVAVVFFISSWMCFGAFLQGICLFRRMGWAAAAAPLAPFPWPWGLWWLLFAPHVVVCVVASFSPASFSLSSSSSSFVNLAKGLLILLTVAWFSGQKHEVC